MTRLINADKFKDSMKYVCDSGGWLEPVTTAVKEYVVKNIDAQPTVDAIPIEWIDQFVDKNRGYISRVTITWLLDDWRAEQRRQNESTV